MLNIEVAFASLLENEYVSRGPAGDERAGSSTGEHGDA
jgi:hypothetical protein